MNQPTNAPAEKTEAMKNDESKPPAPASVLGILKFDDRHPKGGWAPGEYMNTCLECKQHFIGDKRARQCADCAYKPLTKIPLTTPEG